MSSAQAPPHARASAARPAHAGRPRGRRPRPPRASPRSAGCRCRSPRPSLLAVAGVFFIGLNGSVEALAAQLALDHVKCFQFAPDARRAIDADRREQRLEGRRTAGRSACRRARRSSSSSSSTSGAACRPRARRRTSCTGGAASRSRSTCSTARATSDAHDERLVVEPRPGSGDLVRRRAHLRGRRARAPPSDLEHIAHYLRRGQ